MGVFVSYSSRDRDVVTSLTRDLQDADEQVWLDQRLAGGDAWWRAILEQIRGCDVFIFALSQNSIQSKPCQAELRYAQELGLPILPVQVGPVDSLQLNPLATLQTIDYRSPTPSTAMRFLSALNRTRAQRAPLPSPLPAEPPVPFEYLIRLYTTIAGPDYLSPPDQAALVAQLQFGLREDGEHDAARSDILMLLGKLRDREDVTYRTRNDVEAILASLAATQSDQPPAKSVGFAATEAENHPPEAPKPVPPQHDRELAEPAPFLGTASQEAAPVLDTASRDPTPAIDIAPQEPAAGPPNEAAELSNPVAFGALSANPLSSVAYGPEQILNELLPAAGSAAFALLLPIIGAVVLLLFLIAASQRQVATAYTRVGGAYQVARANFGLPAARVAAAALVLDSVATVAVQSAAGSVAIASAIPGMGPHVMEIAAGLVLILCSVHLRGPRNARLSSALPTFVFVGSIALVIVTGTVRSLVVGLPRYDAANIDGAVPVHQGSGLVMGATVLVVLRAFANGASSLTGTEMISSSGKVFREPQAVNARRVLTAAACVLGFLLIGVAWLTYRTHAVPYADGYPSMLSEIIRAVFGNGIFGIVLYILLQAATAAVLIAGASSGFTSFRALAGQLVDEQVVEEQGRAKHTQQLRIATGLLALLAVVLIFVTSGSITALLPLYVIPVFTAFSMTGYAMTKHHLDHRDRGWSRGVAIHLTAGILSSVVVLIFVMAKFVVGAWLVVVVFPILVLGLTRLNR